MTDTIEIVPLAEMKDHLRIIEAEAYFDGDVTAKLEAARKHVEAYTGPLDAFEGGVPGDIKEALKLLAGHLFQNREASAIDVPELMPLGFHDLIGPYRKWEF